ncbi:shikimate kinase [Lacunimicrobium album]
MLITLIGYRGTGKTSVAQALAERLGWAWVDADVLLVERAGKSIADIFATQGEAAFRDLESSLLRELISRKNMVLATGGGIVIRSENRDLLKTLNPVVWLTATPETIQARLEADVKTAANRPALTSLPAAEEIRALLELRGPWYTEVATLKVSTDDKSTDAITHEILTALQLDRGTA